MKENLIRAENRARLRNALLHAGAATKPMLSQMTGLSVVTVGSLMNRLLADGEVLATGENEQNGGRPAMIYQYNPDYLRTMAIAVRHEPGMELMQLEIRNAFGQTLLRRERALEIADTDFLDDEIAAALAECGNVRAAALALSGEEVNGIMVCSDYPALCGKSVSGHIREKFGMPVCVENDVKAALTGYCARNPECAERTVTALYMPEEHGPGTAIWENGHVLHGRNGMSGELWLLPLGIDWDAPVKDAAFRQEALSKLMLCLLAMANPHRMVLYGRGISPEMIETARAYCAKPGGGALLPDAICPENYAQDILEGAARLAWQLAAPELEE